MIVYASRISIFANKFIFFLLKQKLVNKYLELINSATKFWWNICTVFIIWYEKQVAVDILEAKVLYF